MLIAEELVLLALRPDGKLARGATNQSVVAIGVVGALVTELAIDGHLEIVDGKIHVTGTRPTHPLLVQALDNTAPFDGKKLKSKLSAIKKSGWPEVVDRMIDQGIVGREQAPLRPTRHPITDVAGHDQLLAEVHEAGQSIGPLTPRLATLLALAGPCQLLEVVAPEREERKAARKRIDTAADQVPAAAAVSAAIEAVQAATIAIIAASTVAASSS